MKLRKYSQTLIIGALLLGSASSGLVYAEESVMNTTDSAIMSTAPLISDSTVDTTTTDTIVESTGELPIESTIESTTESNLENTIQESTSASSEIEMEVSEYQTPATQVSIIDGIVGDGTESAPFQVKDTYTQFNDVAAMIKTSNYQTTTNSSVVYIKVMSDITDFPSNAVKFDGFKEGIAIDGIKDSSLESTEQNRWYLNYNGSESASYGDFYVPSGNDNKFITFKNINFGSKDNSTQNYYGMCAISSANFTQKMENISYYATSGGQPFWLTTGSINTLNFSGKNSFISLASSGSTSQEFAEFQGDMNFEEDSQTSIIHKTSHDAALFYHRGNPLDITLKNNAKVFIQSGKQYMTYGGGKTSFTLNENSQFTYSFDNNLSYIDPQTVFEGE